jgi:hypothetical protein
MFAPHHRQAAQELLRVCKPGGTVAFTTWLTTGLAGRMFAVIGKHAPPPPAGVQPPPSWGDREHVRDTVAPLEPEFAEDVVVYEWDSAEGLAQFFFENFGPLVTLQATLTPEQAAALRADYVAMLEDVNEAPGGAMKATAEYLITTVRCP